MLLILMKEDQIYKDPGFQAETKTQSEGSKIHTPCMESVRILRRASKNHAHKSRLLPKQVNRKH